MGFFDNVILEENSSISTTSIPTSQLAWNQQTWWNQEDGNFLIIDDWISQIKAEDIPDSVVSLLDETNKINETSKEEEISTSEENTFIEEKKENTDFTSSLFDKTDKLEIDKPEEIDTIEKINPIKDEEKNIKEFSKNEEKKENTKNFSFDNIPEESKNKGNLSNSSNFLTKADDPNIILEEATSKLNKLLKWHEKIREAKMKKVEDINLQIAELKKEAKKQTDEAKKIATEEDKVQKMIEMFQTQKISK